MNDILKHLVETKSLEVKEEGPFFIWSSGIESPIYCDNRRLLSYPSIRKSIVDEFVTRLKDTKIDGICAVATAGIPWASLISERMNLPLIYVRSDFKKHGQRNKIEGNASELSCVAVIEDLISTGGSSLKVVDTLVDEGVNVEGVYSLFNYNLSSAKTRFKEYNVKLNSLGSINDILDTDLLTDKMKSNLREFLC